MFPKCGAPPPPRETGDGPLGGGAQVVYVRDIFILNKICVQDKVYILIGNLLG
jgi:hypothetical protein